MMKTVAVIIVAFNSDINRLKRLNSLLNDQGEIIIVDNSTVVDVQEEIRSLCISERIIYIPLNGNKGIAAAQNKGIDWARKRGFEDVLLMDDDSVPDSYLIFNLMNQRRTAIGQYCVISARPISDHGKDLGNVRANNSQMTPCQEMMSSGTLIPMEIINLVGPFNEDLFIDCVDFEWGWRALKKGVHIYISNKTFIQHKLGDGEFCFVNVPVPVRQYYQIRNSLKMIFTMGVPLNWRIKYFFILPAKIIVSLLFMNERPKRFKYIFLGIRDFIIGISGEYPHSI